MRVFTEQGEGGALGNHSKFGYQVDAGMVSTEEGGRGEGFRVVRASWQPDTQSDTSIVTTGKHEGEGRLGYHRKTHTYVIRC